MLLMLLLDTGTAANQIVEAAFVKTDQIEILFFVDAIFFAF